MHQNDSRPTSRLYGYYPKILPEERPVRAHNYCIYTDRGVSKMEGSPDHIFPLSLGGKDEFVVWSDRQANSVIGSEVDGALANDPLVEFARRNSGVRGHSKKPPEPRWHHSKIDARPIQVTWGKDKVSVWDAIQRRELDEIEFQGKEINSTINIGRHTCHRFVAKVALAGGYFVYGNNFRGAVNCNELRSLVFLDIEKVRREETLNNSEIMICDRFHSDSNLDSPTGIYRALCEGINRSLFIVVPTQTAISFHVGVLGVYIGSIIVSATTDRLPNYEEYDLGHAIVLGPGKLERLSFRMLVQEFKHTIQSKTSS